LFSNIDIKVTVSLIEAEYANSGMGRPRYSVRSMLLALMFMRFEAIPSVRKLCRKLERREYARDICEFGDRTPKHNTFSLFITRAKPETIEKLFIEFRTQAFQMGIIDPSEAVMASVDSTFIEAYSRRGRKGGISDRGARVGKTERRSYKLGWRAHTAASMKAYPITYIVRAANVNDKILVNPLMKKASSLLKRYGKRISHAIADSQYYSAEDGKLEVERHSQGPDARSPMLLMHTGSSSCSPQDRKTRPSKQHSSLHILKRQKTLQTQKQAQKQLMNTYARACC
jgi:transposase